MDPLDLTQISPYLSRVGPELDLVVTGSVKAAMPGAPLPRPLLGLIERGERPLAAHATAEFDLFWRTALAPYWPDVRAALDADVTYRAHLIACHGLTTMLSTLHPTSPGTAATYTSPASSAATSPTPTAWY